MNGFRRRHSLVLMLACTIPATALAQDTLHFVPKGRLVVRDINKMPWETLAPGPLVKMVVGSIGSFTLAEFAPSARTTAHHILRWQPAGASAGFELHLDDFFARAAGEDWSDPR